MWPEVQELEDEEEGAEAKKARLRAKRSAKKNEKKVAKRKDVRFTPSVVALLQLPGHRAK